MGRFEADGVEYIDPGLRHFTELPAWLRDHSAELEGKTVLAYCTGGVRCERTSGVIQDVVPSARVFQLSGGICRYLEAFPTGGNFRGKNYVFDKRRLEGPGGPPLSSCSICGCAWDDHRGKRKCRTCRVPVLVCRLCQSRGEDQSAALLCELCDPASERYKPRAAPYARDASV